MSALQALLIFVAGAAVISVLFLFAPVSRTRQDFMLLSGGLGLLALILLVSVLLGPPRFEAAQAFTPPPTAIATDEAIATSAPTPQDEAEPSATAQPATVTVAPTSAPSASPTVALTVTAPALTPTAATATPDATNTAAPTATSLSTSITSTVLSQVGNIRSAPRDNGPVVGLVNVGDEVVFLGVSGDWYLVRLGQETASASYITGGQGWVNELVVEPPARQPPVVTPTP